MKLVTMSFVLALVLSVSISVAMATSDALSQCVMAAMHGPEKKFLKIFDHEFHCKPLQRVPLSGGGTQFTGQLSHELTLRPDDQFYYQFVIRNGVLEKDSITRKIADGGFDMIAGAAAAVGAYYGVPVSPKDAADFWDKAAKSVVGRGWNEVADMIVASVAMQATAEASSPKSIPKDYRLVTRPPQQNDSQKWILTSLGNNTYTIQQKSSNRYMDAYQSEDHDYQFVTLPSHNNDTQRWLILQ